MENKTTEKNSKKKSTMFCHIWNIWKIQRLYQSLGETAVRFTLILGSWLFYWNQLNDLDMLSGASWNSDFLARAEVRMFLMSTIVLIATYTADFWIMYQSNKENKKPLMLSGCTFFVFLENIFLISAKNGECVYPLFCLLS